MSFLFSKSCDFEKVHIDEAKVCVCVSALALAKAEDYS